MKLRCDKLNLMDAVNTVMKAVPAKSNLPVLEGILLKAKNSVLTLIGNDTSLSIETVIPVACDQNGEVVIEAKRLFDMIRKLPSGAIDIEVDENLNTRIWNEQSVYKTMALSSEEFPAVTIVSKDHFISLPSDKLKKMIRSTLFAVSQETTTRQVLNGSLFEIEKDNMNIVALDGFRLAVRSEAISSENEFHFIVPYKALSELVKVLPDGEDKVEISVSKKYALFEFGNTKLVTRLIEGEFFDYRKSIPTESKIKIALNVDEIKSSVERVEPIISSLAKPNPIRLSLHNDYMDIDCQTSTGVVHDTISIEPCGEELNIGFNYRYFEDAIKACECEKITLSFNSSNSPCLIEPAEGKEFWYLVLPVRSNG